MRYLTTKEFLIEYNKYDNPKTLIGVDSTSYLPYMYIENTDIAILVQVIEENEKG